MAPTAEAVRPNAQRFLVGVLKEAGGAGRESGALAEVVCPDIDTHVTFLLGFRDTVFMSY